jgi:hypothetical protein
VITLRDNFSGPYIPCVERNLKKLMFPLQLAQQSIYLTLILSGRKEKESVVWELLRDLHHKAKSPNFSYVVRGKRTLHFDKRLARHVESSSWRFKLPLLFRPP